MSVSVDRGDLVLEANAQPPVALLDELAQHAVCLNCRRAITPDGRVVTFYAEGEPVGFVCTACVSSGCRALLRSKKA